MDTIKPIIEDGTEKIETVIEKENMALSDYRNLYTFTGRSDGLNLIVYGILIPLALVGLSLFTGNGTVIAVSILLSLVIGLAAVVRRGRDAGNTPTHTIATLVISSLLIATIMEKSLLSLMIIGASGNVIVGMIVVTLIQNIYLVYLIFASKSEVEVPKTSKAVKIILIFIIGIIVVGLLSSIIIPKVA